MGARKKKGGVRVIRLYGARISDLPSVSEMAGGLLSPILLEGWIRRHGAPEERESVRASLGGLLLLQSAGVVGALSYTDRGRPFLRESGVEFNLSHTSRHVLCAVGEARVGVDVEEFDRTVSDPARLSERWFGLAEREKFLQDSTHEQFLRIWTQKEALVKWTGEGLGTRECPDSVTAPDEMGVALRLYEDDGAVVALCAERTAEFPSAVEWIRDF